MAVSKEEYLKRYLSGNDGDKEKKKKKRKTASSSQPRMKIIDDDITVNHLLPSNLTNTLEEDVGDNDPTIAEFIDERPEHIKRLEEYEDSTRWRKLHHQKARKRHDSDSDQSVERHQSDSDQSLPRRGRHDSDSDQSPPRRGRHDSDSDQSPPRRRRHDSGSDQSPPRRGRHDSDSDQSPPRRGRHDSDSDQSPQRKSSKNTLSAKGKSSAKSHTNKRSRHSSESDQSPPRRGRHDSDSDQSPPRRKHDSDQSPPRRRHDSDQSPPRRGRHVSNQSPRRTHKQSSDKHIKSSDKDSVKRKRKSRFDNPDDDIKQISHALKKNFGEKDKEKATKTLSGAKAGLSSAREMREEADKIRRREEESFKRVDAEALGKNAKTVFRNKEGKRRDMGKEREEEEEKERRKAAMEAKYAEWGKGLKQQEDMANKLASSLHEASKPLARYRDDDDLDQMLKEQDREGDPMAMFMKKKKKKGNVKEKPKYKGPAPPPNRFNLMPGYRWDGVDRSNGFEKMLFQKQAEKRAVEKMAYKWGVEDM